MIKLSKLGETFRGAKGTYLITKGHIDKYELYLNEDHLQKNDDGELHFTFKFIQAFQFKKDLIREIKVIEKDFTTSEEYIRNLISSGLMTKEEGEGMIQAYKLGIRYDDF